MLDPEMETDYPYVNDKEPGYVSAYTSDPGCKHIVTDWWTNYAKSRPNED